MDENSIFSLSPVLDDSGGRYIPTVRFPYDGGMARCRADRIGPDGQRETGYLLEEFCPRVFLPYLTRGETGRLQFRAESASLNGAFEAARARFWARAEAFSKIGPLSAAPDRPFVRSFQRESAGSPTLIVKTDTAVTLREFVKTGRPGALSAVYVRQSLAIVLALTEMLQALKGRWLVSALTPDNVLISQDPEGDGVRVQLSDAAYLFPVSPLPGYPAGPAFSWAWVREDVPSDDFTDPCLTEAGGPLLAEGGGLLPNRADGLYSVSQLMCYLLFFKTWDLYAETLLVRFPPIGVLRREALREVLEDAAGLGLRLVPAPEKRERREEFERLLRKAMEETKEEDGNVFPS